MGLKYNEVTGEFEEEKDLGYGDLVFDSVSGEFRFKRSGATMPSKKTTPNSTSVLLNRIKSSIIEILNRHKIIPGVTKLTELKLNGNGFTYKKYYDGGQESNDSWRFYSNNRYKIIDAVHVSVYRLSDSNIFKEAKNTNEWREIFESLRFCVIEDRAPQIYNSDYGKYALSYMTCKNDLLGIELKLGLFDNTPLENVDYDTAIKMCSLDFILNNISGTQLRAWLGIFESIEGSIPVFKFGQDNHIIKGFNIDNTNDRTRVIIPEGAIRIEDKAFANTSEIKEVKFPQSLVSIGKDAFKGCHNLTKITLGSCIESIEDGAFESTSLQNVTIPAKVRHIGTNAFECHVKVGKTNRYYSAIDGALYSKDMSTLYRYPINDIPNDVTIPEGVKTIGPFAFSECRMSSVSLPASITLFKESCFYGCDMLQTATIGSEVSVQLFEDKAFNRRHTQSTLYVNGKYLKIAKSLSILSRFKNILAIPGTEVIEIISTSRVRSMMFPIDGLSIFNNMYRSELGYEKIFDKYIRTTEGHKFILRDGLVAGVVISRSSSIPGAWIRLGLDWKLSFNKSVECLKKIGFNVTSQRWKVKTNEHYNRQYIVGEIKAETLEKDLHVALKFDWDNEHPYSAPSTLDAPHGLREISIIYK